MSDCSRRPLWLSGWMVGITLEVGLSCLLSDHAATVAGLASWLLAVCWLCGYTYTGIRRAFYIYKVFLFALFLCDPDLDQTPII